MQEARKNAHITRTLFLQNKINRHAFAEIWVNKDTGGDYQEDGKAIDTGEPRQTEMIAILK